jgi:uncharacterized protein (DUF362 family)
MGAVGIARADQSHFARGIAEAIEKAGGIPNISDQICIKINLCDCRTPETGAVTDPQFLEAFLSYLQENFKLERIYVAESDATVARADLLMKWLGFDEILHRFNATWVNLSRAPTKSVSIQGRHFKQVEIPELILDSFLISMAKLKTHILTTISCALKNVYGGLPRPRKIVYHPFLDDAIVDANLAMKAKFSIVDGVVAHVGTQGPAYGIPVRGNLVVAGDDPVSVDSACSKLFGFTPFFVGHVRKAHYSGVGSMRPRVAGPDFKGFRLGAEYSLLQKFAFSAAQRIRKGKSVGRTTSL